MSKLTKNATSKLRIVLFIIGASIIGVASLLGVLFGLVAGGVIDTTRTKIVFSSESREFIYDGTAHTAAGWTLIDGQIKEGHEAIVVVTGSRTDVGAETNYLSATIVDNKGTDVTDYYDIEYQPGTINVVAENLYITSASSDKIYDGTTLRCEEFSVTDGNLAEGHTAVAEFEGELTDVGSVANKFSVRILNQNGEDCTFNYNLNLTNGVLTVTKRAITVIAPDAEKIYDGIPLSAQEYDVIGEVAQGQQLSVTVEGSIVNCGSIKNRLAARVLDSTGEDVSYNYALTLNEGTLKVIAREISILSADEKKVYDGTPLKGSKYDISGGSLADGQTLSVEFLSEQTDVGKTGNNYSYLITDNQNADVTLNYSVTAEFGTLSVTAREISVLSYSDEKVYDGTALTNGEYEITVGSLADGQDLNVTVKGSQTNVGESDNTFVYDILNENNESVLSNYTVTEEYGVLKVTSRPITVTSDGDEKVYNGAELTNDNYEITIGSLADGQDFTVTLNGSQLNVGESDNTFVYGSAFIKGVDGEDVTENYTISYVCGVLKVNSRPIVIISDDQTWTYDGEAHSYDAHSVKDGAYGLVDGHTTTAYSLVAITDVGNTSNSLLVNVYDGNDADVTYNYAISYVYGVLKVNPRPITVISEGKTWTYDGEAHSHDGHSIAEGEDGLVLDHYTEAYNLATITDAGNTNNTLFVKVYDGNNADVTGNYLIRYNYGNLKINPRPITVVSEDQTWTYDGEAHSFGGYSISEGEDGLVLDHHTESYSLATITNAGYTDNSLYVNVYDGNDNIVTNNYAISYDYGMLYVVPRPITVTADSATKIYDGEALTCGTYSVTSRLQLVDGHTVTAQTSGSQTDVGENGNTIVTGSVYVYDGNNVNITYNYSISYGSGTLKVDPRPITVTAGSGTKTYDGEALTCNTYSVTSTLQLADGHTVTAQTSGSQTDAGESSNTIVTGSVAIYDGNSVNVTNNYSISYGSGTLKVDPRPITVTADSATKIYDGNELTCDTCSVTSTLRLVYGHTVTTQTSGSQTDVGVGSNIIEAGTVVIYDGNNVNVTNNYSISCGNGTLKVDPRPITLTADSATKSYDGTALTCATYSVTSTLQLADGHTITAQTSGSQTDVGESGNAIATGSVAIYDGNAVNVTGNYTISCVSGTLRVDPRPITVRSEGQTWTYDGEEHSWEECSVVESNGLVSGHYTVALNYATITDCGFINNTLTVEVYDGNGVNVTRNYDISYEYGALNITSRPITVTSNSAEKTYDGTPLTADGASVTVGTLATGHSLEANVYGSRTNAGEGENSFSVIIRDAAGTDVTTNYSVTLVCGTLKVNQLYLAVSTMSAEKIYDGEPLTCQLWGYASDTDVLPGHTATAVMPASQTSIGVCENYIAQMTILDVESNDVTDNYSITYFNGRLIVIPRTITVRSGSASKEYDGTALTCGEWSITSYTQPVSTHTVNVYISGERTEIGESDNTISEVIITDADGVNVTNNYDIKYEFGVLLVKDTGSGAGGSGAGGGSGLDTSGNISGGPSGTASTALRIYSEEDGRLYLRLTSFGDYNGGGWGSATSYSGLIDEVYSLNYMTGIALSQAGYTDTLVRIESYTSDYMLPYYVATGNLGDYQIQVSDVSYSGDTESIYSLYCYLYDFVSEGEINVSLGEYASYESVYAQFVRDNYLSLSGASAELLDYFNSIISEQNFNGYSDIAEKVGKVAQYIQNSAEYNLEYDTALDGRSDKVYAFLTEFKEGICQHYASAATLLYRALGIPARYTVGYVGNAKAGEWVDITTANAHAWVEVYIDGMGWVNVEVTGGSGSGGDDVLIADYDLKPVNMYMRYGDGTVLRHSGELQGLSNLLELGYTYSAEVVGEQRTVGISESEIKSFTLYDPAGQDVTELFTFKFSKGKLQVYIEELTVTTYGAVGVYDGQALTNSNYNISGTLLSGHSVHQCVTTGSQISVGKSINSFDIVIVNSEGQDVTYMYKINGVYGVLNVLPREITITVSSASKPYDGTALTSSDYTISSEYDQAIATGQSIDVTIIGSQTNIGYSENTVSSVEIYDEAGKKVTQNYKIVIVSGTLRVLPPED